MRLAEYGLYIQKVQKLDAYGEWYMVDLHNECVAWITKQNDVWWLTDAAGEKQRVAVSSPQDIDIIHKTITEWQDETE